jgi:hypothetical protein
MRSVNAIKAFFAVEKVLGFSGSFSSKSRSTSACREAIIIIRIDGCGAESGRELKAPAFLSNVLGGPSFTPSRSIVIRHYLWAKKTCLCCH